MKNKQVMNRQTSSKELHLISCGWEKCTPEQSYALVSGDITPSILC